MTHGAELVELRALALELGADVTDTPSSVLAAVLRRAGGDLDLAATALAIRPRPAWVLELERTPAG